MYVRPTDMTHWVGIVEVVDYRSDGNKGEKKWNNSNSIINKMCFKKSHDLISVRWRPRKSGGIIQSKSEVLRRSGANGAYYI